MPSQEIEEIRARHEAATKGPYEWLNANPYGKGTEFDCLQGPNGELMIQPFHDGAMMRTGGFCDRAADAEALAASWADRATLLDEVDRLRERNAELEAHTYCAYCGDKFPLSDPGKAKEAVAAHINECTAHPVAALKAEIAALRRHGLPARKA